MSHQGYRGKFERICGAGQSPTVAQPLYDLEIEKLRDVTMQNTLFFTARSYSVTDDDDNDDDDGDDIKCFLVMGFPAPSYFYWSIYTSTLRKNLPICRSREPDILRIGHAILTIKINN